MKLLLLIFLSFTSSIFCREVNINKEHESAFLRFKATTTDLSRCLNATDSKIRKISSVAEAIVLKTKINDCVHIGKDMSAARRVANKCFGISSKYKPKLNLPDMYAALKGDKKAAVRLLNLNAVIYKPMVAKLKNEEKLLTAFIETEDCNILQQQPEVMSQIVYSTSSKKKRKEFTLIVEESLTMKIPRFEASTPAPRKLDSKMLKLRAKPRNAEKEQLLRKPKRVFPKIEKTEEEKLERTDQDLLEEFLAPVLNS